MASSDVFQEIGRLKQQVETKEALLVELREEKTVLDHANQQMHDELAEATVKLRRSEGEKARLVGDLRRLNEELVEQASTIDKLNEQIIKQKKTIQVQSDQIQAPKEGSKARYTTPHHVGPPHTSIDIYRAPPPSFNLPLRNQPPAYPTPTPAPPSQRRDSTMHSGSAHPPMPHQSAVIHHPPPPPPPPFYGPNPPPVNRYGPNQDPTRRPSEASNAYGNWPVNHGTLVTQRGGDTEINLLQEVSSVFNLVETFARNFVNVPDKYKDSNMPLVTKNMIIQQTNPAIAMTLITTGATRYFAVSKIVNYDIVNFAFRPMVVRGFQPFFDQRMTEIRGQLTVGIAMHIRRGILTAAAQLVQEMTETPGWQEYVERTVQTRASEIWHIIQPLFAHGAALDEAWDDLKHIWSEAMRVGVLMNKKPSLFTLDFPPTGANSFFNPSNMVNRDLSFKVDPITLGNMGLKVRLAITPVVTETDFGGGSVVPKNLHFANVLLQY